MNNQAIPETTSLRKKIRFYKTLSLLLACVVLSAGVVESVRWIRNNAQDLGLIDMDEEGPYYRQIKELMTPLRYSGLKDLLDGEAGLSIDFEKAQWTLHNIHRFDKDGKIVLKEGRYGLCGDLAAYMHEKVSPLLDKRYSIDFVLVAESNFFPPPHGSHVVLKIADTSLSFIRHAFILDPSFRKYRRMEYFDDYLFFEEKPTLAFLEEKSRDETFLVNITAPLLIHGDYMLGISVNAVEGRFDKDNFAIVLGLTQRHRYFARQICRLRKKNGIIDTSKNEELALKVLKKEEFEGLCEKIRSFFEKL